MIGGDRIVGLLGKIASPFRPTTRKRGGDPTTTMRQRDVTAVINLGGTGPSPSCPLWTAPTSLSRSQPSRLLPIQDKTEGRSFLQRLRKPSAGSYSHFLDCPASDPVWCAIFGTTSSIFYLWSRLLGLRGIPPCPPPPHLSEGVGYQHHHVAQNTTGMSILVKINLNRFSNY